MIFNPNIFKAYDIRGLYPEELSTELAHTVGRAFVEYISAKDIAVGYAGILTLTSNCTPGRSNSWWGPRARSWNG